MAVLVKDVSEQRYKFTCEQWDLMTDASKAAWTVVENTCGIITSAGSPFAASEFLFTLDGKVAAEVPLTINPVDGVSTIRFLNQPQKTVLAGPISGADAYPTFRLLQLSDLPAGVGTVTSVAATAPPAGFTITGSPITTSGTFTFALADDLAALEGLTGTGILVRTAANTYALRTLSAGAGINITFPNGVAGDPVIAANTSSFYYQRLKDAGISFTQRGVLNITDSVRIAGTLVDDSINDETELSFDLVANSVADGYLSTRGGLTVMGRASPTQGNVADIVSTADGQVLRRNGLTLDWGTVVTAGITDNAVTNAKIRQGVARSVIGVTGNATANVADIQGTADQVLRVNTAGTALAFGTVDTGGITNSAVTYAKIQNVSATSRVLGRITAGAGVVEELTVANLYTMLGLSAAAGRIMIATGTNTITTSPQFLWDNTNNRQTITGTVAATGANNAFLNLNSGALAADTDFLRMSGNVTGKMNSVLVNANNASVAASSIYSASVGGANAGDPMMQFIINGVVTHTIGTDNSDGDKFKITPNATAPGGTVNKGFIITNDATPKFGFNTDAPGRDLDMASIVARSKQWVSENNNPTVGAAGAGLGTGGVINAISGCNNGFYITFSTGTSPTTDGALFTVTFQTSFTTEHYPVFVHGNKATADEFTKFIFDGFAPGIIKMKANGTLTANTSYRLHFLTIGL